MNHVKSTKNRKYVSPARERKAAETRNRILDATETLLQEKGFAGMTVAELAARAGVSPQTVYAIFTSKAGIIIAAIEDRVLRDDRNVHALHQIHSSEDPLVVLRSMARLVRNVYESNAATFKAVFGAAVVSPQIGQLDRQLSELRRERQLPIALELHGSGKLQPHLGIEDVRDIIWVLTSREVYYLMAAKRGWTGDKYEEMLSAMLVSALLPPTCPSCTGG